MRKLKLIAIIITIVTVIIAIAVFNSRGNQTTSTNTLGKDANAVATTNYLEDYRE